MKVFAVERFEGVYVADMDHMLGYLQRKEPKAGVVSRDAKSRIRTTAVCDKPVL